MTEQEWLESNSLYDLKKALCIGGGINDPNDPMGPVFLLHHSVTERRVRLYSCGCVRQVSKRIIRRVRFPLGRIEAYADCEYESYSILRQARRELRGSITDSRREFLINRFLRRMTWDDDIGERFLRWEEPLNRFLPERKRIHILRDIFGNPFGSPVPCRSEWCTLQVQQLAKQIYSECDWVALPVLGDMLEEAGCTESRVLDHCHQPGIHVRGCWVLDLLLGKE